VAAGSRRFNTARLVAELAGALRGSGPPGPPRTAVGGCGPLDQPGPRGPASPRWSAKRESHGPPRCLTGGRAGRVPAYFFEPTVVTDVPATARVWPAREIFGPGGHRSWAFLDEAEAGCYWPNDPEYTFPRRLTSTSKPRIRTPVQRPGACAWTTGHARFQPGCGVQRGRKPFGGALKQSRARRREGGAEGRPQYPRHQRYVACCAPNPLPA